LGTSSWDSLVSCTITSLDSTLYNCVAWAAGDSDRFWWPDSQGIGYWPQNAPREVTANAFISAFLTLGYEPCEGGRLEPGFEKIVIYELHGKPTHAARQLESGRWTSKLGKWVDIEHDTPEAVVAFPKCANYGRPIQFLRRQRPT